MLFKLFHNESECPFDYDTEESFVKEYLWQAERLVSEGDKTRDEETLSYFIKNAPQDIGAHIDILLRAYIFSCCDHISSYSSYNNDIQNIMSSAINKYKQFIDVYEKC